MDLEDNGTMEMLAMLGFIGRFKDTDAILAGN